MNKWEFWKWRLPLAAAIAAGIQAEIMMREPDTMLDQLGKFLVMWPFVTVMVLASATVFWFLYVHLPYLAITKIRALWRTRKVEK